MAVIRGKGKIHLMRPPRLLLYTAVIIVCYHTVQNAVESKASHKLLGRKKNNDGKNKTSSHIFFGCPRTRAVRVVVSVLAQCRQWEGKPRVDYFDGTAVSIHTRRGQDSAAT